jgi:hypothetical protein
MRQYIQVFVHSDPTDVNLNRHRWGYHLGAPNFRSGHSSFLTSSILSFLLIAPSDLQLYQYLDHLAKSI